MTEHLIIGDLSFARATSASAVDEHMPANYAEHPVIEGKPLLQYTGDGLRELYLDFLFHADFCVPQDVWDSLVELLEDHKAVPLVQGNGLFLGYFVLQDLSRTTTVTADDGTLYAIEARLRFKEYVDPAPLATLAQAQKNAAPAQQQAGKKPGLPVANKDVSGAAPAAGGYTQVSQSTVVRQ